MTDSRPGPWRTTSILLLAIAVSVVAAWPFNRQASAQQDARYFADTGFRIDHDGIWDYFNKRGGVRTFGMPSSRTVRILGAPTQLFQRHVVQATANGVQVLNLLDDGLLPYTTINGSTFPSVDASVVGAAPRPGSPGYDAAVLDFVKANAPNTFEGEPVGFYDTFSSTVTLADAFPGGGGDPGLLPLFNLELWGQPTSRPTRDPNNNSFIYLRFQRGIMHYDAACKCTQGLLLADYLKALLTGVNLPEDLAAQAADSRFRAQYDPETHTGPLRLESLPDTDLGNAFRPSLDQTPLAAPPARQAATPTRAPSTTTPAAPVTPAPTATPGGSSGRSRGTPTATPARSGSGQSAAVPGSPPIGFPDGIVVKLEEAGKDAKRSGDPEKYEDGRVKWHAVRYERPQTYAGLRSGPVTIYSKALVFHDAETARQVFEEEADRNSKFPEAKERVRDVFELNVEGDEDVGDEAKGQSACNPNCGGDKEVFLHRRMVFRVDNMVGIVYTYGLDDPEGNTQKNTRYFAAKMVFRMRN